MALIANLDTAVAPSPAGKFSASIASFLRPADNTPYTALDVISTTGAAAAIQFLGCGRSGAIRNVSVTNRLETDTITPRLWVFDAEPTNLADNAAFALVTADVPKIVGFFDFVDVDKVQVGSGTQFYTTTRTVGGNATGPVSYTTATGSLYGLLQTVAGYTPNQSTQWTIKLGLEHD